MDSTRAALPADDFCAIHNLYARYNLCSDAGDVAGYVDCFTADGRLEVQPLDFKVAGQAQLRQHKERDANSRGGRYRRHWNGSIYLEALEPGAVRGRCYLVAYNGEPAQLPGIADVGVYDDRVVKCADGQWRFAQRLLVMDASTWRRT
jgi:hypothetical protein